MMGFAKTIARLIIVLIDTGVIEREKAAWILEPLLGKAEIEPQEGSDEE